MPDSSTWSRCTWVVSLPDAISEHSKLLLKDLFGLCAWHALGKDATFQRLLGRRHLLPGIVVLLLSAGQAGAHRLEPPEQIVDPLLLKLQPPQRELHAGAGRCHLFHRGAQPAHLDQKSGQDVLPLSRLRPMGSEPALQRRPHGKPRRNQDENADASSHIASSSEQV